MENVGKQHVLYKMEFQGLDDISTGFHRINLILEDLVKFFKFLIFFPDGENMAEI